MCLCGILDWNASNFIKKMEPASENEHKNVFFIIPKSLEREICLCICFFKHRVVYLFTAAFYSQ